MPVAKNYDALIKLSKSNQFGQLDDWGSESVNCYAFAVNCKNPGTPKPVPGGSAPVGGIYTAEFLRKGAVKDGLKEIYLPKNNKQINELKDYYLVAGFVRNIKGNSDHHWYRGAPGNIWTHKPGSTSIVNMDGSNPPKILNGDIASTTFDHRGYEFVGYFFCPKKGLSLS